MEDKDIELIEEKINKGYIYVNCGDTTEKAIMNLLRAYKQDEKVIEEMAKELRIRQYNCYGKSTKIIIEQFRKKCE